MALSILSLVRERLPCSENYWRYRRNFELHFENNQKDSSNMSVSDSKQGDE